MMYIVKYLLKLVLAYLVIVILAETVFANLEAHSIDPSAYDWMNVTLASLSSSFDHACNLEWRKLIAIKLSLWVYNNKIHYILMVLVALVLYYHYKDSQLKQPNISRLPRKDVD